MTELVIALRWFVVILAAVAVLALVAWVALFGLDFGDDDE